MPCPTTTVILGILTMKYPAVHKGLYNALTHFAVWIGSFQILLGYVPDYLLAMVGYYALGLIISDRCAWRRRNRALRPSVVRTGSQVSIDVLLPKYSI